MKPLVSILIPAYNAETWIADTIRSAIAQTWDRTEIIVVDDGSKDRTVDIARAFESPTVKVVRQENQGAAATRNHLIRLSQGDFLQWLDADDLLAPQKIERQLEVHLRDGETRFLYSSGWSYFMYRPRKATFRPSELWHDLSPIEWLIRKMSLNLHMQTATWLTSRELCDDAGPWDIRLVNDDDGEYFSRVLVASKGVRFCDPIGVYYRDRGGARLSRVGASQRQMESIALSMSKHVAYIRSLEESERVRKACCIYLANWLPDFHPERPDLVENAQTLASELGGLLPPPRLRWKYAWMAPLFGKRVAKHAQLMLPRIKSELCQRWDRLLHSLEGGGGSNSEL